MSEHGPVTPLAVRRPKRPSGRRRRQLREVTEDFKRRGIGLDMAENLPRSELYDRDRARTEAAGTKDPRSGPRRA